jgi:AcrR family transcriptional regulator
MRADARRNRESLLAAARAAFTAHGADASLDDIARRAGVGIGTLYRHFPTREALIEAAYRDGVATLCAEAEALLASPSPGDALETWLRAFVAYGTTKRGLAAALMTVLGDEVPRIFATSHDAIFTVGEALLTRAKESGAVRSDVELGDLLKLVNGIILSNEKTPGDAGQPDRLLSLVMDGLRYQRPTETSSPVPTNP